MNSVIRIFNYRFTVKELLIVIFSYLLMEQIFLWILVPTSSFVQPFQKLSQFAIFGFMLFILPQLKLVERIYVCIFTLLILRLVVESLYEYNTFFKQLTMFYVLFPVIYVFFIKYLCRTYKLDLLEFMAKFYLVIWFVFMAMYGRGFSFSLQGLDLEDLGVFSGDGRIIHATSVFMMMLPLLWSLNKYIQKGKRVDLGIFILCTIIIFIHQHRSVWSSAIFGMVLYFAITLRNNKKSISNIWKLTLGAIVILLFTYFFASTIFPDQVAFFGERFSEIFDPGQQESTGRFRVEQREVYFKLFLERPVFGWTFEGFEMTNPLVDWWPEKTGQHFHEGFMESLFYHGLVGFIYKYSILAYLIFRAFSKKLTHQTIVMISFCLAGLVFCLSYVPQIVFWGHVGLCLYYLEMDDQRNKEEKEIKYYPKQYRRKLPEPESAHEI